MIFGFAERNRLATEGAPIAGHRRPGERTVDTSPMDPALAVQPPRQVSVHPGLRPVSVRTVLALAGPTIAEQFLLGAIGLTDTIVAGHLPGNEGIRAAALAAVGIMTYLQWFVGLNVGALAAGATAIVARSIGARRPRVANRVAGTAMTAGLLLGMVIAAIMYFFAPQIVHASGLYDLAADYGQKFLRIMVITVDARRYRVQAAVHGTQERANGARRD